MRPGNCATVLGSELLIVLLNLSAFVLWDRHREHLGSVQANVQYCSDRCEGLHCHTMMVLPLNLGAVSWVQRVSVQKAVNKEHMMSPA